MAFLQCEIKSDTLGKACCLDVILPEKSSASPTGKIGGPKREYKVVYLLHGLSDDQSGWTRLTSIERYAREREIVVVMPDGGRSFYSDMKHGLAYWSFLSKELPEIVYSMFPVSPKRCDTYAAGLSMGGYGALKLGLNCPECFEAVGALSPVIDIPDKFTNPNYAGWHNMFKDIFGTPEECDADGCDILKLAKRVRTAPELPRIIHFCGLDDGLLPDSQKFRDVMKETAWPVYSFTEAPGSHNWAFWDAHIPEVLDFLLNRR